VILYHIILDGGAFLPAFGSRFDVDDGHGSPLVPPGLTKLTRRCEPLEGGAVDDDTRDWKSFWLRTPKSLATP
jgi:hypothetical protein